MLNSTIKHKKGKYKGVDNLRREERSLFVKGFNQK